MLGIFHPFLSKSSVDLNTLIHYMLLDQAPQEVSHLSDVNAQVEISDILNW